MMKNDKQYRDAALGAFIGYVGITIVCIAMIIIKEIYGLS